MGSGEFAVPSLLALAEHGHEIAGVVTQPDRPKGRGRKPAAPPVKLEAERLGLSVVQPPRVRDPDVQSALRELAPDAQVVVAYGQILPPSVIVIPRLGTLNVHASLLPRYRGAAPIQWAIAKGETVTGVTTMLIDAGLDTGPTLLARETPIAADETAPELSARLAVLGAEVLIETLVGLQSGGLTPQPQDDAHATLAPPLRKQDGLFDWSLPAAAIANRVRAFDPWPGVFVPFREAALRLHRVRPEPTRGASFAPGRIIDIGPEGILVACGEGDLLRLLEVQPESRRVMPAVAFAAGARLRDGDMLAP